jgi:hypothetical protein
LSRFQSANGGGTEYITYLRFSCFGALGAFDAARTLDTGIVRTLWVTPQEVRDSADRHRSPLVLQCLEDYLKGQRYPMGLIFTDSSVVQVGGLL